MFKKSPPMAQIGIFNFSSFLSEQSLKEYNDPESWHNLFRNQVIERIDENIFRCLFCEDNGAPNASIRVLVGMNILKAARNYSDAQLLEECKFNPLVRSALGLFNIDDNVPCKSTYYNFRQRIEARESAGLGNLMEEAFASITKSQMMVFNINGSKARMDSTLLGSNIAWNGRYAVIHETIRLAYTECKSVIDEFLTEKDIEILMQLFENSAENVSYYSNKSELEFKITQLGSIIYKIVINTQDTAVKAITTLHRVFYDQYEIIDNVVSPLPKSQIKATSVQSPHDTDCHYHSKSETDVKGYTINVCEINDVEKNVKITTDVKVEPASHPDTAFFQPAIERTQAIVSDKIETISTDGAYYSFENQNFCTTNGIDFVVSGIQGFAPRYDLFITEEGVLHALDTQTNIIYKADNVKSHKPNSQVKWVITLENGKKRYFTERDLINNEARKELSNRTQEELNFRNNSEASIFQYCYHFPDKKSCFRGLFKHQIWAYFRGLWVNFRSLMKYIKKGGFNPIIDGKMMAILHYFLHFNKILINIIKKVFFIRKLEKNFKFLGNFKNYLLDWTQILFTKFMLKNTNNDFDKFN
jgi:hypothetical protein